MAPSHIQCTAEQQIAIIIETSRLSEQELSEYCRKKGLIYGASPSFCYPPQDTVIYQLSLLPPWFLWFWQKSYRALFKQKIESLAGRQMTEKKRGRPLGWSRYID